MSKLNNLHKAAIDAENAFVRGTLDALATARDIDPYTLPDDVQARFKYAVEHLTAAIKAVEKLATLAAQIDRY